MKINVPAAGGLGAGTGAGAGEVARHAHTCATLD